MRHKLTTFIVRNPPVKIKKGKNKNTGDAAEGVGGAGNSASTAEHDESQENGADTSLKPSNKV